MKLHIWVDTHSGLVHSPSVSAGNVRDIQELPNLVHGDSASRGKKQRERLKDIVPQTKDFTNKRASKNQPQRCEELALEESRLQVTLRNKMGIL